MQAMVASMFRAATKTTEGNGVLEDDTGAYLTGGLHNGSKIGRNVISFGYRYRYELSLFHLR